MEDSEDLDRCGVGIRGVAMTIDSFVWFALFMVATFAIAIPTGQVEQTADGVDASLEGTLGALGFVVWLALGIGYHTLLEWRSGQTIGKYLVSIRAVSGDGTPLTLWDSALRNVARLVDWLPFFYVVGIVTLAVSENHERLGDRLADTAVVR